MTLSTTALSILVKFVQLGISFVVCHNLSVIMQSVILVSEWHHVEWHYAEWRYAEWSYAEGRYAEGHYAKCHGTSILRLSSLHIMYVYGLTQPRH